jgi:dTDP-glucose pyrophosphorylase
MARKSGETVFGYRISDPGCLGMVEFDGAVFTLGIEEKAIHT